MGFTRLSVLVAFFCFATITLSAAEFSVKNGGNDKANFNVTSLPTRDKLMLLLATKLSPQTFQHFPKEFFAELSDYAAMPTIDNFFIDARQLFIQAKKLGEDANLPEFNWGYRYTFDFCFWGYCFSFDTEAKYSTSDSKFVGAESVVSDTQITPTSIQNTLHIPYFNWTSPGFLINVTDYIRETINLSGNSFVSFTDVTVAFSTDYHFVEGVGIQLENFTIYLNAGEVRGWLLDITEWNFEGELIEKYEPEEYPYDEMMMSFWNYNKRQYTAGLQYSLNCFLSNGRSDPENCLNDDEANDESKYYRLLNMQFIQAIGLGSILK